jgi:hypothetical protein
MPPFDFFWFASGALAGMLFVFAVIGAVVWITIANSPKPLAEGRWTLVLENGERLERPTWEALVRSAVLRVSGTCGGTERVRRMLLQHPRASPGAYAIAR